MKRSIALFVFSLIVGLTSCQRDRISGDAVINERITSLNQVVVPHDFDFETSQEYKFIFALGETTPFQGKYLVQWYTDFPHAKAKARHSAFMDLNNPFVSDVTLPANTQRVYVKLTSPTGSSFVQEMVVNNTTSHTFYTGKKASKAATYSCPSCSSGCDQTIASAGNEDFNINQVYCVTGTDNPSKGPFDWVIENGAEVRVCTSINLKKLEIKDNHSKLIITSGTVTVSDEFSMNSSNQNLIICSGATLSYDKKLQVNLDGMVSNYGTFNLDADDKKIYFDGGITNNGSCTITTSDVCEFRNTATNNGSFVFNSDVTIAEGDYVTNNCTWIVNGSSNKFKIYGNFSNNSYVKVEHETEVDKKNSPWSTIELGDGSFFITEELELKEQNAAKKARVNGPTGAGEIALLKVEGTGSNAVKGDGDITGHTELWLPSGQGTGGWNLSSDVTLGSSTYIPTSACMPVGNGTPPIQDADSDGVADNVDEYPNDATRAYNVYSPSQGSYKTFAVEDLFPYKGDFDFNDLVVDYNIQSVTNADNEIVEQFVTVVTKAMGGSKDKGFGFNLSNLVPGDVSSVTGASNYPQSGDGDLNVSLGPNGTENSQASAVIIAYNSVNDHWADAAEGSFQNVRSADAYQDPDTSVLTITYTTPYDGTINVEPFAFVGARSKEIHTKNTEPTDLMDDSFFGTGDDDSNGSSTFYTTANGLPWAIVIEDGMETIEEKNDITTAYLKFASWASSGGNSFGDWNTNNGGDYRDGTKLYTK